MWDQLSPLHLHCISSLFLLWVEFLQESREHGNRVQILLPLKDALMKVRLRLELISLCKPPVEDQGYILVAFIALLLGLFEVGFVLCWGRPIKLKMAAYFFKVLVSEERYVFDSLAPLIGVQLQIINGNASLPCHWIVGDVMSLPKVNPEKHDLGQELSTEVRHISTV